MHKSGTRKAEAMETRPTFLLASRAGRDGDDRNFYKVELWTKDEQRALHLLYAGNNLDKARTILGNYIRIRPRARITIRQRTRVLEQWPRQGLTRNIPTG